MKHLRLLPMLSLLAMGACVALPAEHARRPQISIDMAHMRAVAPQWQSELIDCSDKTFRCIEAQGRFLMAFPRSCPRDFGPWIEGWVIAGHLFRFTAPDPHLPLPTGGYFSEKYPHAYLLFDADAGFTTLWERTNTVTSDNWGGSSEAEYGFTYVDGHSPFACS